MNRNFTKFAFTKSVKDVQERHGSRSAYARMEASGDRYVLTGKEKEFISSRDSFYLATVGENGWPYAQFRGGPIGFLKVIDDTTLAMADYRGNLQYISVGNINATRKASLFLMDYPSRTRLKIWAESEILDAGENEELLKKVTDPDYDAVIERLIVFNVQAYDWNCQQHITPRYTVAEIRQGRIEL
ncbi:MAG: pyridoxamine 5'-phosphate oxidase family protein [Acidobacteria bacterium]|uniref:Pyridoxamine 5'-phosphate oxidase family protein n=1 Tax=Candidatus Polarisedimenticola svalbardensis TaxID=2886004 RepID=A0A8J6Y319_9BACT|nr:pyridoxamine 5'-phosphate oxidase family protein [Candidatus Polarisedimenticola svalbardensis]